MSDDVIKFPQKSANPNVTDCGPPTVIANIGAMEVTMEVTADGLGFTDMEAALNMRDWLERACEAAGGKRVAGGIGFGQADIDIELEGCRFNISIRPLS